MFPLKKLFLCTFTAISLFSFCGCQSPNLNIKAEEEITITPTSPSPTMTNTPTPTPTLTPTPTNIEYSAEYLWLHPLLTTTPTPTCTSTPTPVITKLTFSFAGDVTLGSDVINQNSTRNFYAVYDQVQDDAYFFANVLPYFSSDDLTLINLEGVLSSGGTRKDKTYAFRGDPSYVNILTLGSVEAVCLANNHSFDYGTESHYDTRNILTKANILYSYDDIVSYTTIKEKKIAFISIYAYRNGLDGSKKLLDTTIAKAKAENVDLIITSFHWGVERSTTITAEQQKLAYYAIDSGSNLVIGHHPHVLQPIEKYKDSYIVYSLGNFCFGGNTNPKDKDTIIFRQTFTFIDGILTPDNQVEVIPCSISSVTDRNNYQPTPQTGEEAKRIMEKLNGYCTAYDLKFIEQTDGVYIPEL